MASAPGPKKKTRPRASARKGPAPGMVIRALLAKETVREVLAVCAFLLAVYTVLCLGSHPNIGWELLPTGWLGYYLASFWLAALGLAAWMMPLLLALWAALLVRSLLLWHRRLSGVLLLMTGLSLAAGSGMVVPGGQDLWLNSLQGLGGGLLGNYLALGVQSLAGSAGLYITITAFMATGLLLAAAIPLKEWPARFRVLFQALRQKLIMTRQPGLKAEPQAAATATAGHGELPNAFSEDSVLIRPDLDSSGMGSSGEAVHGPVLEKREDKPGEGEKPSSPADSMAAVSRPASAPYQKPSLDLLRDITEERTIDRQSIQKKVKVLEQTFANFGIEVKVVEVSCGPVVTRYELSPAPGVKVSRISSLADDLQLSMAARGLRLEAPIPGKAAIGIEIPNDKLASVSLKSILASQAFQSLDNPLAMALGEDIAGNMVVGELNEMPHMLVAGATGSGKSVCVNAMIISLLFNAHPDDVKMILIDPKKVELTGYNGIPHLLAPVVTDPRKAARILKWMTQEMEKRYQLFTECGVRDIKRYNEKAGEKLPFIIVVIDELADLMMVSPAEVEDSICRLAQMARAAGIHLIVSTQRPSVDVITGLIKANIPSRIAFAVSSQVDSRTILDGAGAEKLLGKGDMLYMPIGAIKPLRVQGAFVSDSETVALVEFLKTQTTAVENSDENTPLEAEMEQYEDEADDVLFWDAVRLVVAEERLSASYLQRKMKVGYSRAARLVDMMEERGIVSSMGADRKRRILISAEELEQILARKRF